MLCHVVDVACCCVMCCGWAVRVVVLVPVAVCVCVRFVPSCTEKLSGVCIQSAPVCTFKTLPCVPSKRPCYIRHGHFESTEGSVLNSLSLGLPLSRLSLFSHVSLSSHLFSYVSVSCVSLFILSNHSLSSAHLSLSLSRVGR